jgi:ligand-binding sensor domain-containing protein
MNTVRVVPAILTAALLVPSLSFAGWETFDVANGLSGNDVYKIFQDRKGDIWTVTDGGVGAPFAVSRFDGAKWTTVNVEPVPGDLLITDIIAMDPAGGVWADGYGGMIHYDGTSWYSVAIDYGRWRSPFVDHLGRLWMNAPGSATNVASLNGTTWTKYSVTPRAGPGTFAEDPQGSVWYFASLNGSGVEASRFDGTQWDTVELPAGGPGSSVGATFDHDGNLWIASKGLFRLSGSQWTVFTTADGLPSDYPSQPIVDGAGHILASFVPAPADVQPQPGARQGVAEFDGQQWRVDPEPPQGVRTGPFLKDIEGNLWFATDAGVARYDRSSWKSFTAADGLPTESQMAGIVEEQSGDLWAEAVQDLGGGMLSRFDGRTWAPVTPPDGFYVLSHGPFADPVGEFGSCRSTRGYRAISRESGHTTPFRTYRRGAPTSRPSTSAERARSGLEQTSA